MSKRKSYEIIMFTVIMIMINFMGKTIASLYELPVWMDSFGTVLAAYVCDPFCGAVVGLASNIIYGFQDPLSLLYGLTSIAIGISVGVAARKKLFETVFGTLTASVIVTLFSVVISTPINLLTGDGMVGNKWGNGVVSYLLESEVPPVLATITGEFYMDFLDKVITLLVLFFAIKYVRFRRKLHNDIRKNHQENRRIDNEQESKKAAAGNQALSVLALWTALTLLLPGARAQAYADDINNNNIQVIYSSDNGLPCGEANDVLQTNDGILWVGTYAGLYRYNGSEFRLMNYDSVRNVNCLFMDEEGRLWIGTNDNGLSIAIHEKITNVVDIQSGLPANSVRSITMATDGNYYIGTTSSLMILTLNGGMNIVAEIPEIVYAHSIAAGPDNVVAAVTNDGGIFLIKGEEIFNSLRLNAEQEIFTCAAFDEQGVLYVGTSSNHVYYYDISTGSFKTKGLLECKGLSNINRIFFAEDGTMYMCSDSGAAYRDTHREYHLINMGEFNNSVDNMAVDYQGNLWFSSSRLGLLKLSHSPFTDVYRSAGMQGSVVNTVVRWKGNLYVGTDNGLDIIDSATYKELENDLTKSLDGVRIRCLAVDDEENLWICTYRKGLIRVTKDGDITEYNSTNKLFGDWARVVRELSDGTMAASCDTCLGLFQSGKLQKTILYEDGLGKAMILCLEELSDGRLLCGTDGDGIAIVKDGAVIGRYTREDGLSSDVVLRVVSDPVEQGAYIITSNGLCYLDGGDKIHFVENFPYYNNYDLWAFEDGSLFVFSSAGIYVVSRDQLFDSNAKVEYELLDSKRGLGVALTANSWNYLENDGDLYLSSDNGVFRFNIHDYGASRKSYRMKVSAIYLDGAEHELERGEEFHIGRDVAKIEIFPEVINYTADDPSVSYFLEGFDSAPNVIPQSALSSIVYTNIPAGNYRFHLGVLDNKNEKILEESIFELVKDNEIYDTRWFHIYMLVVAMLAVAWLTWFIARTQIQRTINFQKKELEFTRNQLRMGNETILAIAKTVDAKDENTSLHSQRVSEYSVQIAKKLGFSEEECENIRKAALLHDIGKIGIPDRVLNKAGRLNDEEYALMKSHVTRGAEILKDFTLVEHAVDGTKFHHERYDGTGYPQGLSGEGIPLYGRIIGVADAFDAMTANRVYRKKLDFDIVVKELKAGRGAQFDPKLVDIMFDLLRTRAIDVDVLYGKHIELEGLLTDLQQDDKSNDSSKPADGKNDSSKATDGKNDSNKPADGKNDSSKAADGKNDRSKPADGKNDSSKATDGKNDSSKPADKKAESKMTADEDAGSSKPAGKGGDGE